MYALKLTLFSNISVVCTMLKLNSLLGLFDLFQVLTDKDSKNGDVKAPEAEIGWVTEAKDWAGELISGQTTTGRILVSLKLSQA